MNDSLIFNDIIVYVYKMHVRIQGDLDMCKIIKKSYFMHIENLTWQPSSYRCYPWSYDPAPHVLHFQYPFVLRRIGRGR